MYVGIYAIAFANTCIDSIWSLVNISYITYIVTYSYITLHYRHFKHQYTYV